MYLVDLIFPSTSMIVPTASLQILTQNIMASIVLRIVCSIFSRIFATYIHKNFPLLPPAFHQKILSYSIDLVLSSVVYFGTI